MKMRLRVEGGSLRRWLNQEAVLRAVAEEAGAHSVTWIFPAHRQLQSDPAPPVGSQHSCQPTVKLHVLPLVWIFTLGKGQCGGAGGSSWDLPCSSKTPAHAMDQFATFCGFDILLTPHSSQMASTTPPPACLSQGPGRPRSRSRDAAQKLKDRTFIMTPRQVELHLTTRFCAATSTMLAHTFPIPGHPQGPGMFGITMVNIVELQQALRQAVRNMRDQGILAR